VVLRRYLVKTSCESKKTNTLILKEGESKKSEKEKEKMSKHCRSP